MTSYNGYPGRNRDMQDMLERHVYVDMEYVPNAGSVVKVKGTGTEDQEVPVIATGFGFRAPKDTDLEVLVVGGGSDTNLKFAMLQLPADKQREWAEGRSGVQNALDPTHAIEFRDGRAHITKGTFTVGDGSIFEVTPTGVIIRGNLAVSGVITSSERVVAPVVVQGISPTIPPATP